MTAAAAEPPRPDEGSKVRKVAVLGGGMAGLATAWRLSTDHQAGELEITVYEASWQLGGKGASGRGMHGRIEEHGLHVWLGYYDNAFRLIREVYDDLDRPRTDPDSPITTWREAFRPAGRVGVEERTGHGWQHWVASFSPSPGEPGDVHRPGGTASTSEFVRRGVRLLADFSTSLLQMRTPPAQPTETVHRPSSTSASGSDSTSASGSAPTVVLSGSSRPPSGHDSATTSTSRSGTDLAGLVQQAQFATVIAAVEAIRLLGSALPAGAADVLIEQLARMRADLDVVITRGDPSLRRLGELADLVVSCCLGIVADGLLTDPAGFGAIDDEDFRDWLRRHGARPGTLESALVRGMYDLVFAYVDGDRDQPRFAAGLGLFLAGKFFFDYRGSLFWHLQAGMGDVVFAPLYQALRRRGVRFAFFHRLDQLQLDDDHQRISSIMITRTHRLHRPGIDYQPLITFGGLSCFPAEPDLNQMVDPADGSGPEIVELRAGRDFDVAVLAVPPGALAGPCQELATHSPSWRAMIDNVATVATQSVQLWLRPSESELGWDFPAATVSGYRPPFDTYASMTHLLEREQWPVENRPRTLGYFCGSLRLDDSGAPTAEPVAVVRANAARFMDDHAGHFWPAAADQDGFRRDLVVDQYVRANAVGSQRYVQSLPGTQRFRLQVDESGIDNLLLAGDWTNCGLNAGCIEAAVLSGLEAANVILGRSLMDDIAGTWYGVQA